MVTYMGYKRNFAKHIVKHLLRKAGTMSSAAGAILLSVSLASCSGEQAHGEESMQQSPVQLSDIMQDVEEPGGVTGPSGESSGEMPSVGDSTQGITTEDPSSQGGDVEGSGLPEGSGAASSMPGSGTPESTPDTALEPIVEKLTPEGIGWGLVYGDPGVQPAGNASSRELALYDAYFLDEGDEKVVYLTFDCGYENGNTEKILDALKNHDAPATFFVVGHYLETEPEIVRRMVEEGHAVGNHTYHHYDINTLDGDGFQKELEDVEVLFKEITGKELSPYYRPPEGKCGTTNLTQAKELGYATCLWSMAYVDWDQDNQPTRQSALDKLTARIHPGAVILLHNTSSTNGEILDELLTKWEEMGYTFAPLSELTQK